METTTLVAPDISCEHCQHAIEGAIGTLAGVSHVQVDIPTKSQLRSSKSHAGKDRGGARRYRLHGSEIAERFFPRCTKADAGKSACVGFCCVVEACS